MLLDPQSVPASLEGDDADSQPRERAQPAEPDGALLDAYSASVAAAVDLVAPAVMRHPDGRWTVDAWAPLEGRTINGGLRVSF